MNTNSNKYDFSVIGTSVPRKDARDKATGAVQYTDDLKLPGMLIGKINAAPMPMPGYTQ